MNLTKYLKREGQFIIFLLVSVLLPFAREYLPYIMFLWVLSVSFTIHKNNLRSYQNKALIIFPSLFFLINLLGLLYSKNFVIGIKNIEILLSLFFFTVHYFFYSKKS